MATLFQDISDRLTSLDYRIGGRSALVADVESLFQVQQRTGPAVARQALSPQFCEEHLATALTAVRQAIDDRQRYFDAGEKFALLALSLTTDEQATTLLRAEADALLLRQSISEASRDGETQTLAELLDQRTAITEFVDRVRPGAEFVAGDAERNGKLAYISHSARGFDNMTQLWGSTAQTDPSPVAGVGAITLQPTQAVVDLELILTQRATAAGFRVTHERAIVDQRGTEAAVSASETRLNIARAANRFDLANTQLASDRATAAASVFARKQAMAREIALLDFERQMQLHRRRAQDLHVEAFERAGAAIDGLRAVYGFSLPDVPASTIESAEDLLFWCREVARVIVGFEPRVARQRITFSARELIGTSWRRQAPRGISIDATSLGELGNVVRARDVGVRAIGDRRSSFVVQLDGPASVRDRDVTGSLRTMTQAAVRLRLLTTPAADQDAATRKSSARGVHNVCPSGPWVVTANAPDGVDDLLLDFDISYFGA